MPTDLLTEPTAAIDPLFAEAWQRGLDNLQPSPSELAHGLELHRNLTVCEHYGFLPLAWSPAAVAARETGSDGASYVDFERRQHFLRTVGFTETPAAKQEFFGALETAGVHGIVLPVNDYGEALADAVQRIAAFRHLCLSFPERLFQTGDAAGIERAQVTRSTALIFSLSGMPVFGQGDMTDPHQLLEWVDTWYAMGVRFMHLGYNRRNLFADGCTELNDGGLSDLGRDLVAKMNEVGMIIDLPHSSRNTALETAKISAQPVIASHVGVREVHEGPRCKSDEELKAIAATGGYVGIYSVPSLLGENADLNLMLRHVAHALKVVGPEHVVIGTDVGHNGRSPGPMQRVGGNWRRVIAGGWNEHKPRVDGGSGHLGGSLAWTNKPLITVGLVKLGLSDEAIAQMHFGNLRRVLGAAARKG
ncbi:MAG TPA: membrane dipeptidase [Chthoniobacteraceae bacterium]|nr:membrane dipeptidase [Chthoniobacteraceae bacterium]